MRTWASAGGGRGGECPGDAHGCGASRSCLKLCVLVCTCYYLRLFILPLNKTPISGDVSILQLNNRACLIDLHAKNAVTLGRILSLYTYSIHTIPHLEAYVLTYLHQLPPPIARTSRCHVSHPHAITQIAIRKT